MTLPNSATKRSFVAIERPREGSLRGGTGSEGKADTSGCGAPDGGAAAQKPCSTGSALGRNDEVWRWEKETGSAGGKLGSSPWCSSLARSKGSSTTKLRILDASGALTISWEQPRPVMSALSCSPGGAGSDDGVGEGGNSGVLGCSLACRSEFSLP